MGGVCGRRRAETEWLRWREGAIQGDGRWWCWRRAGEEEEHVRQWWRWRWQAEGDRGWWRWRPHAFVDAEWEDGMWVWRLREEDAPGPNGVVREGDWMVDHAVGASEVLVWRWWDGAEWQWSEWLASAWWRWALCRP